MSSTHSWPERWLRGAVVVLCRVADQLEQARAVPAVLNAGACRVDWTLGVLEALRVCAGVGVLGPGP
eukprot:COSAG05_NODE_818_length_7136_cov_1156.705841_2_plen_67_part_00